MYSKTKAVFYRFLRGAGASAVASMVMIQVSGVNSFEDVETFLKALIIAGFVGGVTGGLMALDKYLRIK